MNILLVDMNMKYMAPTRFNTISMLKSCFNVDFYGLGYVDEYTLKQGLKKFISRSDKKYDFIFIDYIIALGIDFERENFKFFPYHVKFFDYKLIKKYINKISLEAKEIDIPKIIIMLEFDYYSVSENTLRKLEQIDNSYYLTNGDDFLGSCHSETNKEKHNKYASNNFLTFIETNYNKIITFVTYISENEFFWGDISNRKFKICVPGVNYYRRKKAIQLLKNNYKLPSKLYMKVFSAMDKLKINPYSNLILLNLYNTLYWKMLIESMTAFVSAGAYNGPVRKFFEIPAAGCCMIMDPFNGYDKLGFKQNENFIFSTYDNLIEVLQNITLKEIDDIAKSGRELIWEKHTTVKRAKNLYIILESILNKNFNGTYWDNGVIKYYNLFMQGSYTC